MQISDLGLSAHHPPRSSLTFRPRGRPPVNLDDAQVVVLRDEAGLSWRAMGKKLGVGATTVRRAYQQAKTLHDPDRNDPSKEPIDGESARRPIPTAR